MTRKNILLTSIVCIGMTFAATASAAELLYQWQEADGSLTFSPTPPPKGSGIDFKVIKSTAQNKTSPVQLTPTALKSVPAIPKSTPANRQIPTEKVAYAPSASGLQQGITAAPTQAIVATAEPAATETDNDAIAANTKNHHCGKLRKRITSLEHIMASSRDAQTMDDTVVQINRYQNSFNQHCAR